MLPKMGRHIRRVAQRDNAGGHSEGPWKKSTVHDECVCVCVCVCVGWELKKCPITKCQTDQNSLGSTKSKTITLQSPSP